MPIKMTKGNVKLVYWFPYGATGRHLTVRLDELANPDNPIHVAIDTMSRLYGEPRILQAAERGEK